MNVLIIDSEECGLDFALRCQDYGHDVRLFISKPDSTVGEGLVTLIKDWKSSMKWSDIVVLTGNDKYLKELDVYRKKGYAIFGPSYEAAQLEIDRKLGQDTLEKCGIKTLPTVEFHSYDKAIAYVKKTMGRYVSKPNGDNADKSLSYVSKSPADMVYMLERWKKKGKLDGGFSLQTFMPGIEFAVSGWFGPKGFADVFEENFEFKKLMPGDLGPNTGEQLTVLKYVKKSKLAEKVLLPLEPVLKELGYIGSIDINCIIDERGNAWPLEFTCRLGWPAFFIHLALQKGDPVKWMLDLIDGKVKGPEVDMDIACGLVLSIPDYPYSKYTRKDVTGIPVYGITPKIRNQIHPAYMMSGTAPAMVGGQVKDQKMLVTAGDYVLITTGTGKTVKEACENSYKIIEQIELPGDPMYRTDGGERLEKQLPKLHALGYAKEFNYG